MLHIRFATDYVLHRLKAKNRHGLHSPFVYRFVDDVIYDFSEKKLYHEIEEIRKVLKSDKRVINITDLGAGSILNKSKKKAVSEIAKNALKKPKLAQLLFRIARSLQPDSIIELGTCLGITTVYLQKASPSAKVFTMEGCAETATIAREIIQKTGNNNTEIIVGNFNDTLPALINQLPKLDIVFVDGNHQKEATLKYFEWCLPKVHENSLLIFDDIYWSECMKEAWKQIKANPAVTVTIDLFWIGLVFFRRGQAKEDFLIKI